MGGQISSEIDVATAKTSLKENFDEMCAYAISIGMSYHDFWYEDIDMFKTYIKAEEMRLKAKNREMWLQGMYVYSAIGSLAPILNGFAKDHKARPYIKQPIPITEKERIEQENQKVLNFKNYLKSMSKGGKKNG